MTHKIERRADGLAVLSLKRGKEESLDRFHPWVFSGALRQMPSQGEEIDEGEVVAVEAADGRPIGLGHFQIGSIAVRMLTFDATENIDETFFRNRIATAYSLRRALGLPSAQTDAFRLVHGEGDFLPGQIGRAHV